MLLPCHWNCLLLIQCKQIKKGEWFWNHYKHFLLCSQLKRSSRSVVLSLRAWLNDSAPVSPISLSLKIIEKKRWIVKEIVGESLVWYSLQTLSFVSAVFVFKASLNSTAPVSPKWSSVQDDNETRVICIYWLSCLPPTLSSLRVVFFFNASINAVAPVSPNWFSVSQMWVQSFTRKNPTHGKSILSTYHPDWEQWALYWFSMLHSMILFLHLWFRYLKSKTRVKDKNNNKCNKNLFSQLILISVSAWFDFSASLNPVVPWSSIKLAEKCKSYDMSSSEKKGVVYICSHNLRWASWVLCLTLILHQVLSLLPFQFCCLLNQWKKTMLMNKSYLDLSIKTVLTFKVEFTERRVRNECLTQCPCTCFINATPCRTKNSHTSKKHLCIRIFVPTLKIEDSQSWICLQSFTQDDCLFVN